MVGNMVENQSKESIVKEMVGSFVKGNEVLCCILMELCEGMGKDYAKVMIGGMNRYYEWKKGEMEIECKKGVSERGVVEEELVDTVKYSDDEKIDMWVRDYNDFISKGELGKAECLLGLIERNEEKGLVRRFERIIGKVGNVG